MYSREQQNELIGLNDPTSWHIRFMPNLICPISCRCISILIDCKSTMTQTELLSVCLDSYNILCEWAYRGEKILFVYPSSDPFSGYRAEWAENLDGAIVRKVTGPAAPKRTNGSGRPFVLISKNKLRSLREIMTELLGGGELTLQTHTLPL